MRTVCIYHENCFDGMASAWVVSKVYPDAVFIPMSYGDDWRHKIYSALNYPSDDRPQIVMVDFSLPRVAMIELHSFVNNYMLVLDHHKTAQAACEGLDFCTFDMNESGASLAWKHFFGEKELPRLVRYIKDRDLWLFKEPYSEEINAYIQSYPMTIENYEWLYKEVEYTVDRVTTGGQAINRYKQTMIEAICKTAAGTDKYPFYDSSIPIVNTSLLFSEVGHELCKKFPGAKFAAYYYDRLGSNVRQWGLRSIGDFDVSEVAKSLGGGGHKNAAGFEQRLDAL